MDRLEAMQTFVRVAELGSFAAVAQQLGVARSVVTRQIAALEQRLGGPLFTRSTRRLALTSAGSAFLERCRVILNLVEAAETDAAAERAVVRGSVRMGVPLSYGLKRLAPLLLQFAERHPAVALEVDYTDRRLDLVEQGFDLAIRVTARLAPSDVVRRLGTCRLQVVAAPDYLARHGTPVHPSELASHECLTYTGDPNPQAWSFLIDGQVQRIAIRSRFASNNGEVLLDAAAHGFGVALQPDFITDTWLADGRLVPILEAYTPPPLGVHALLPGGRHMPYRVRALLEFLADALA